MLQFPACWEEDPRLPAGGLVQGVGKRMGFGVRQSVHLTGEVGVAMWVNHGAWHIVSA